MGSITDDVDLLRGEFFPVPRVGAPLRMGAKLIPHGRVVGKCAKFEKMIHPVAGQFQPRTLFNVSRQKPLHEIRTPVGLFQNSKNPWMKTPLPTG